MVRKLALFTLLAGMVAFSSAPVYARESNELDDRRSGLNEVEQAVDTTDDSTVSGGEQVVEETEQSARDRVAAQREQIEVRKAELEAKLRQKKAERTEALEGRRLAMCQNREANINSLLDKSVQKGQEHLLRIQRFEEGVVRFYTKKQLSSADYEAAADAVSIAEGKAVAALNVLNEDFSCTSLDGAKPSNSLKESRESKHVALKAYRDSVINLLHVVKAAFAELQTTVEEPEVEAN